MSDPGGLTVDVLARLLREAEQAHADYEKGLGRRDEDWPTWYAEFILDQLRRRRGDPGPGPEPTSSDSGR